MTNKWLHTASFRFVALAAVVFTLSTLLLSIISYYTVVSKMEQQLRTHVSAETSQLLGDYDDHGLDELRHDISERRQRAPIPRLSYTITNAQDISVFDRLALPKMSGWSRVQSNQATDLILLTSVLNDGFRLGVAADTHSIKEFGQALRRSTALTLGAVLLLSVMAGAIVSRRFLARVERLRDITEQVGSGSLSARIPLAGIGDDFEQLAVTINGMLERIENLVTDVQSVSINIAHDLRTPLGRLRYQLESLQDAQTTPQTQRLCDSAIENLDQTLHTFASLLRIAEMESGTAAISHEPIDVSNLVKQIAEVYKAVAEDRGQSLICDINDGAIIKGDHRLLGQLLANLVENAINHNGRDVQICISVTAIDNTVDVVVADNGIGIPPAMQEKVLKPFMRMDPSRQQPGSGLGLSLVKSIAERHNATLILSDNQPGLRVQLTFNQT